MNNNNSDPRPMIKYNASNKQMKQFRKNLKAWEARQTTKKMKKEKNNYTANNAKKVVNNAISRSALLSEHSPTVFPVQWEVTPLGQAPAFGHVPAFGHQAAFTSNNNNINYEAAPGIEGVDYIYNSNGNLIYGDEMRAYLQANPTTNSLPTFGRSRRNRRRATRKNRRASRKTRRMNRK